MTNDDPTNLCNEPNEPRVVTVSQSSRDDILSGKLTVEPWALLLSLPGRHGAGQIDALFTKSRGQFGDPARVRDFGAPNQSHNPFLVILVDVPNHTVSIEIVRNSQALLSFPDETPVLAQWPGQYRSDWFHFTVSDWRAHVERAESKS